MQLYGALCHTMCYVITVLPLYKASPSDVLPDEHELYVRLFNRSAYDSSVRPVFNSSRNVEVYFGFTLIQIMDMDEKNQVLITNAWLEMQWLDERIHWDKDEYNGLEVVRLPAKKLWIPDIVLYNNADDYTTGFMPINAMVHHDGTISWSPPARLQSSCKVDITYFPFDHQTCRMKFGSWTYDKAQVDMLRKFEEVDVSAYTTNGEWMLTNYVIVRNEVIYPISPAIYPDVTIILVIQRRVLYYVLNILFPCFWLNMLSVLTFCLPPDAGEKITLSITVLLSYSVFMLLVAESMPPTSEFVPLIGIYLTFSMAVSSVSVILTVLVLKLHHCAPNQKRVPHWMRRYVLGFLARIVRCSCIAPCVNIRRKSSSSRNSNIMALEVNARLLKEMDAITNGSTRSNHSKVHNSDTSTKRNTASTARHKARSDARSDVNSSKVNLDLTDYSISNRSSLADDDFKISGRSNHTRTMDDILKYLKVMVAKSDADDSNNDVVDEWKQVALVVDRLFFWTFLFLTMVSTVVILVVVPAFKYVAKDGM